MLTVKLLPKTPGMTISFIPCTEPGSVAVTADLHQTMDRVSWALKLGRWADAQKLTVKDCLLATPDEIRDCELQLAHVSQLYLILIFHRHSFKKLRMLLDQRMF